MTIFLQKTYYSPIFSLGTLTILLLLLLLTFSFSFPSFAVETFMKLYRFLCMNKPFERIILHQLIFIIVYFMCVWVCESVFYYMNFYFHFLNDDGNSFFLFCFVLFSVLKISINLWFNKEIAFLKKIYINENILCSVVA